jgi:hypothetical protein
LLVTLKLTKVVELTCALSGADEVKVTEAGVTLIGFLTVKGMTSCGAWTDCIVNVGRRGALSFCAQAVPATDKVNPARSNSKNLCIPNLIPLVLL